VYDETKKNGGCSIEEPFAMSKYDDLGGPGQNPCDDKAGMVPTHRIEYPSMRRRAEEERRSEFSRLGKTSAF
jgi:hypothetical protein